MRSNVEPRLQVEILSEVISLPQMEMQPAAAIPEITHAPLDTPILLGPDSSTPDSFVSLLLASPLPVGRTDSPRSMANWIGNRSPASIADHACQNPMPFAAPAPRAPTSPNDSHSPIPIIAPVPRGPTDAELSVAGWMLGFIEGSPSLTKAAPDVDNEEEDIPPLHL